MKKTPTREEISEKDKWAVNDIYATDELWEKDYNELIKASEKESEYKGKATESKENLYNAIKESQDVDFMVERVYVYAFMRYYEDTTNGKYQEMSGKAQMAASKLAEKYAFLEPEILSMEENVLRDWIKDGELKLYAHMIEDMLAEKEHSLSEKEEALLAKASQVTTVPNEVFSKFNNADVKFGSIKDEEGNEAELTNGKYTLYMESQNRQVRKDAFYGLYSQYKGHINTLAACFYGNVKQAMFNAQARKYNSTMEMYLSGSFIPTKVYTNLIETVDENLSLMHRYVALRKKELKVEELHFYDVYAPMVDNYKWEVSYNEAKEMILKALKPMGEEYLSIVKEGLENGWVDVYENVGKRTGAFSWGVYGTHPYLFLNYSNTLNDVFTLIHEMGHSMHTYYSNKTQPFAYAGYKIFVAEVASTCNESLLMNYLLDNCKDKTQKKYLLNHYMEQFKGTLFRQTMFAEFEMQVHRMAEEGTVLSAENLCRVYKELNKKYFGHEMVIDDEIAYEWARIPHFYTPFYVYQYATGYSAAIAISSKILSGDKQVIEGYKKFLSGGSSMHPIELLKLCNIDMEKPQVVEEALKVFEGLLDEWNN
ncbi:MAG: oligoendopeptidase F [Lachnospira sp.]